MSNPKNEVNEVEAPIRYSSSNPRPLDPAKVAELLEMLPDPSIDPIRPFRWRDPVREKRAQARRKTTSERSATQPNGDPAYAQTEIDGRKIRNHRITWILTHGLDVAPGFQLDHINRDHLDNRIESLREVTSAENGRNSQRRGVRNGDVTTSKYRGVTFDKRWGRWQARIKLNGILTELGRFETERLAAYVHDAVKVMLLCEAGGPPASVYGLNVEDPDSGISSDDLLRFMIEAKPVFGIDLDAIIDRVARNSALH